MEKLDKNIEQCKTIMSFRKSLLKSGRPTPKPIYNIHNRFGLKLFTRLRLGLRHLNEHECNRNFRGYVNLLCHCSLKIESPSFFLHCHHCIDIRKTLFHELQSVAWDILNKSDSEIVELFLCDSKVRNSNSDRTVVY